jgi:hypothetical protein
MKSIFIFAMLCIAFYAHAQAPKGHAKPGDTYGSSFPNQSTIETLNSNQLLLRLSPDSKDTLVVILSGQVKDACSAKGCWLTMDVTPEHELMMKMQDYAFFVPTAIIGKNIQAYGRVFIKTVSVEDLKHYAEDAGKSKAEIDKITKPERQYRFIARGIRVVS